MGTALGAWGEASGVTAGPGAELVGALCFAKRRVSAAGAEPHCWAPGCWPLPAQESAPAPCPVPVSLVSAWQLLHHLPLKRRKFPLHEAS